jgi:hypothetical protein
MNTTLQSIHSKACNSKSSDKLAIIMAGLESMSTEKLNNIKTFEVSWRTEDIHDEGVIVPVVKIEFFS